MGGLFLLRIAREGDHARERLRSTRALIKIRKDGCEKSTELPVNRFIGLEVTCGESECIAFQVDAQPIVAVVAQVRVLRQ